MIQQNPFSIYDFLGYLIPGSLLLFFILFFQSVNSSNIDKISLSYILKPNYNFGAEGTTIFIILSYAVGHFLNFISSLLIERFSNWKYSYPSKYLLGFTVEHSFWMPRSEFMRNAWRLFVAFLILPVTICDYIFGDLLKFKFFYTRGLDPLLQEIVRDKGLNLINMLHNKKETIAIADFDFHRIFAHYTFENSKMHQGKLTNYVVLYGFLRSLTLITTILFWYTVFYFFNEELSLPWWITVGLCLISYVYFMAFMKFYRRYTLEALMIIAIDPNLK